MIVRPHMWSHAHRWDGMPAFRLLRPVRPGEVIVMRYNPSDPADARPDPSWAMVGRWTVAGALMILLPALALGVAKTMWRKVPNESREQGFNTGRKGPTTFQRGPWLWVTQRCMSASVPIYTPSGTDHACGNGTATRGQGVIRRKRGSDIFGNYEQN